MKSNKPSVQLSNVNKEWEKIFLGEISEIKTGPFGSALHAKDYVVSGTPIITTEHFKTGELPLYKAELPQVSNEDYKRLKSYRLKHGDLVFSRVGSVDINALVTEAQSGWLFSGRVLRVRPIKNVDGSYLHYLLDTTLVKNDILSRAVGQIMPSINTEILKNTLIHSSTDVREQKKIGLFFKNLDDTISLHQQELAVLKQTKLGFLQKMFPRAGESIPEVRFEEYEGNWKQKKLGDILKVNSGRDYKHLDEGNIPVYGTGGLMLNVNESLSNEDAIGIGRKGTIDKPQLLRAPFWTVDTLFFMTMKKDIDLYFCFSLITRIPWKKYDESTGVPSLSKTNIDKIVIKIPSYDEQVKIGNFFKKLDAVIELKEQELEALKQTKQGFLQKMFV